METWFHPLSFEKHFRLVCPKFTLSIQVTGTQDSKNNRKGEVIETKVIQLREPDHLKQKQKQKKSESLSTLCFFPSKSWCCPFLLLYVKISRSQLKMRESSHRSLHIHQNWMRKPFLRSQKSDKCWLLFFSKLVNLRETFLEMQTAFL